MSWHTTRILQTSKISLVQIILKMLNISFNNNDEKMISHFDIVNHITIAISVKIIAISYFFPNGAALFIYQLNTLRTPPLNLLNITTVQTAQRKTNSFRM